MKYLSEFRDHEVASKMVERIKKTSTKPARFMEICGTHTVAIFKHGIRDVIPKHIDLKFYILFFHFSKQLCQI